MISNISKVASPDVRLVVSFAVMVLICCRQVVVLAFSL